jgi:lipoyl(octanoyl) transferase
MNENLLEHKNKKVFFKDLGVIEYKEAWDYQTTLFEEIIRIKIKNRDLSPEEKIPTPNYLLFCEHPHVYTLGKSGQREHLLADEKMLSEKNAAFFQSNRGGDITYHGPGQLVAYPILDLDNFFTDIHIYMRSLEEAVILTMREYGLEAGRIKDLTGVWIDYNDLQKTRKICAMGVKTSRWVTMHGLALNVNAELEMFKNIIPCGIVGKEVTSLHKELDKPVSMDEVKKKLLKNISKVFKMELTEENVRNSQDSGLKTQDY